MQLGPITKRAALCVAPEGLEVDPEIDKALRQSARQLEEAGWQVDEVESPPMREAMQLQLQMWMSEYQYNGGEAVLREDDADALFVYQQLLESCQPATLNNFMEALQSRVRLARQWQVFFAKYPLLLCPVSAELPFADMLDVESPASFRRVLEAQLTQIALPFVGVPAMSLCTGSAAGSPVGIQLVAGRFREDVLFDAASEIEARCAAIEIAEPA